MQETEELSRELESVDNRQRILEAAINAFGEHGYEGASTNQICTAAGISKGLLFHYFKSKENLFMAVLEHCMNEFVRSLQSARLEQSTSLADLAAFYRQQADFFSRHPGYYRILTQVPSGQSAALDEFVARAKESFSNKLSLGLRLYLSRSPVRPGVDREVALEMITGIVMRLQEKYISAVSRQEFPGEEVMRLMEKDFLSAVDIISHGILQPGETPSVEKAADTEAGAEAVWVQAAERV